jgi:DNA replication protein DnaC
MTIQEIKDKLVALRLSGMKEALEEQALNTAYAELTFEERLGMLLEGECLRRDNNRLRRRLTQARLMEQVGVEDVDTGAERGLERKQVMALAGGEWIRQKLNLILLGPTGVGKTHLGCALGREACRLGFTVRYLKMQRLLQELILSRADGSIVKLLHALARIQVLILDDWLRDPLTPFQARDILEVLDDRYSRSSTLILSQIPVASWHARLGDPTLADALLDRLVHNAYRFELKGESRRKLQGVKTPHQRITKEAGFHD